VPSPRATATPVPGWTDCASLCADPSTSSSRRDDRHVKPRCGGAGIHVVARRTASNSTRTLPCPTKLRNESPDDPVFSGRFQAILLSLVSGPPTARR
jgi:hypothetical protein